ncbi:hypothetical protein [Syntrophomonas erecta]
MHTMWLLYQSWIDYMNYSPRQMIQLMKMNQRDILLEKLNVEVVHLIDVLSEPSVLETLKEFKQNSETLRLFATMDV